MGCHSPGGPNCLRNLRDGPLQALEGREAITGAKARPGRNQGWLWSEG